MAKIKDYKYLALARIWSDWNPNTLLVRMYIGRVEKTVWQFLIMLNIYLPYGTATLLLSIYPGEMSTYVHQNI